MEIINNILALVFFFGPLLAIRYKKGSIQLADLINCSTTAMGLPDLIICLFHLVTNPEEVKKMQDFSQYMAIGAAVILTLAIDSITKAVNQKKDGWSFSYWPFLGCWWTYKGKGWKCVNTEKTRICT